MELVSAQCTGPINDCDNDGVLNIVDLDDDNDGILDSIECPVVAPTGATVQPEAIFYSDSNARQFFSIGGNTNGLGFSESGWDETVISQGGTIMSDVDFTDATFSNEMVTGFNDATDPITNDYLIAPSTFGPFISGATGSGLSIRPGAADLEGDATLVSSTFINFTTPVYGFGFDLVDFMDHGAEIYTDTWEIFLDGVLSYSIGPTLAIAAGATVSFLVSDAAGNNVGNIVAGENTEVFFGFLSVTQVSQVQIRRTSVFEGGTIGEDAHGIDNFRYTLDAPYDTDNDNIPIQIVMMMVV